MSHRDKTGRTASQPRTQETSAPGTSASELRSAMIELLAGVDFSGIVFRGDCGWSVRALIAAALIWAWSGKLSLQDRFAQARRLIGRLGVGLSPTKVSYQAFMKLLVRWTPELSSRLKSVYRDRMRRDFTGSFRTFGFSLFGGDGSKLQLPRTRSNEGRYSPQKSRKNKQKRGQGRSARRPQSQAARWQRSRDKKGDSPQMALTLLFHLEWRLPWDWRTGPYDSSERGHLGGMIADLPHDALVVADCGFVGYDFWSELLASGRQFVIRVGGNVRLLRKLGRVRESSGTVYLWPDKARERKREPLVLRLVEVHDGRQSWFLVTSVRDTNRLVSTAVLKSPKTNEADAEVIANMKSVSEDVLRAIAQKREWMKKYSLMSAIVRNPRSPFDVTIGLVPRLSQRDQTTLATDRNVPEVVRVTAKRICQRRQL